MKSIYKYILSMVILWIPASGILQAQQKEYLAVIPAFHDRLNISSIEGPLQLNNQRFVVFVFRNAAAVYSEAVFTNTSPNEVEQEFALPSTGHDENGSLPGGKISTGILSVQIWEEGLKIEPDFISLGDEEWYTIKTRFAPYERRKMRARFWIQTSLTDIDSLPGLDTTVIPDGKRGFMFDLSHAAIWNGPIESVTISIILPHGFDLKQEFFTADPDSYEVQDSILTWKFYNIEPETNNIFVWYSSAGVQDSRFNTMAALSAYIVKSVYDELMDYAERTGTE
jgi:hypothetical protein